LINILITVNHNRVSIARVIECRMAFTFFR